MAVNLRAKMPPSHNLIIMDVNDAAVTKFVTEVTSGAAAVDSSKVQTAKSARQVAERSVSKLFQRLISMLRSWANTVLHCARGCHGA